ncbi:MAG: LysR family transcriptional regulator [Pleomorphochaeta sp.]
MTIRHLKIFIAVCDYKSTVEASKQLNIAQPSISFAIKEIENYYGIKLFDRISRKLVLTNDGEKFLFQARDIINKVDNLEINFKDNDSTQIITLGCSATIAIFILPNILKKFKETNKNINFNLIIRDSKTLSQMLLKNELDLALIETPILDKDLVSKPFYNDNLLLYLSKDNKLSKKDIIKLEDLKNENIILRERHSAVRKLVDATFIANNFNTTISWESTSTQAIISLVENNLGITILPSLWSNSLKSDSNIITKQITNLKIKREYSIINHKNKYISPVINEFIINCLNYNY